MEIKCEYCGSIIKETDEKCPYCGATNQAVKRTADHTPKTIEELQQWYQARNLPPYEVTRFFIGINYDGSASNAIYAHHPSDFAGISLANNKQLDDKTFQLATYYYIEAMLGSA